MPTGRRPRIVVAGQTPPPHNGQNTMIARIVAEFARAPQYATAHLLFRFTPEAREMRRGSVRKLLELARVLVRLLRLRAAGPIDLLLFPSGGPQTTPVVRDLLLLPWILLSARCVVVQFHAAGIATRLSERRGWMERLLVALYRRCPVAVVMTNFNRCDPLALGIRHIEVIPHRVPDEFDPALVQRRRGPARLLYAGHLCPEKGTPELLQAFAEIAAADPGLILELAGEPLPPLSEEAIRATIRELGIDAQVEWRGVLTGRAKQEAFGRADLFVFPTVAPFESFGLVIAEAMMWSLPVVLTDWRGNRDVVGPEFDGLCFGLHAGLAKSVARALREALDRWGREPDWGHRNRAIFLARYRFDPAQNDYADGAQRWLQLAR